jgi:murein DD-endopeptidase MepM/ murein hydrolase activator NlpD
MARRMLRLRLLVAVVAVPLALWLVLPVFSSGEPPLSSRIDSKRRQIEAKKGRERVLTTTIAGYTRRIGALQSDIDVLQARQARIQSDLDAKLAELGRIQERLRQERIRLARLRARLAEARITLSKRLVEIYKADKPDMVTVILESDGFAELLERTEFIQRVSAQDARIIRRVKAAKADATATEARLDRLEDRQARITRQVIARRDEVAAIKGNLVTRRTSIEGVRAGKQQALASTRESRHSLEGDLRVLEREQARITARLAGAAGAGPIRRGSGSLIWPVNGPIASPFGQRWGRLHAGWDIAAPSGTPIRAADSGKVVLLGWTGGYGNYTCVAHGGGLSTCYAHQSRYATSNGASVSRGQVIGYVGCTGHCFGDHLHFETRVGGSPVDPSGYL